LTISIQDTAWLKFAHMAEKELHSWQYLHMHNKIMYNKMWKCSYKA